MLVLARRVGESIAIGGEIELSVLAIQGNKVRLGLTAPPSIRVRRAEQGEEGGQHRLTSSSADNGADS